MIVGAGLKKIFEDGVTVLNNINFTIEDGDIYGLVGRSGAGKSTLLRCINGLTSYQEGSLTVDGCEIKSLSKKELREFRKNVGMIFQHFSLLERISVYDNVALPMECWKCSKDEKDKKVKELLDLVGLKDKMHVKPRNLSGGQKQRVAIARALTMDPKILLCDEATSALDPNTTNSILELLAEINKKIGITIVVVTHQMEVVRKVCNKLLILEDGMISTQGDVKDIFIQKPPSLKRLLGVGNLNLPKEGRNIQIAHYVNTYNDGTLFMKMALDLQMAFSIIDGQIQEYKNDKFGTAVINVTEDQYQKIIEYLEEHDCRWQEIFEEEDKGSEIV